MYIAKICRERACARTVTYSFGAGQIPDLKDGVELETRERTRCSDLKSGRSQGLAYGGRAFPVGLSPDWRRSTPGCLSKSAVHLIQSILPESSRAFG